MRWRGWGDGLTSALAGCDDSHRHTAEQSLPRSNLPATTQRAAWVQRPYAEVPTDDMIVPGE
jgi:hypothetical protein